MTYRLPYRAWLVLAVSAVLSLVVACQVGQAEVEATTTAEPTSDPEPFVAGEPSLAWVGGDELRPFYGEELPLTVRYTDQDGEPLGGHRVQFALQGDARGSALGVVEATTDNQGLASTTLIAGNESATFEVRASAPKATVRASVVVSLAGAGAVDVTVLYDGGRDLDSYDVTLVPDESCDFALQQGLVGPVTFSIPSNAPQTSFGDVVPGSHAAIAWGRDAAGAKVAEGCSEVEVVAGETTVVAVILVDRRLDLEGSFEMQAALNVDQSAARVVDAAEEAGVAWLSDQPLAGARRYLDAMEAHLRESGRATDAGFLAANRLGGGVEPSLQGELEAAGLGPRVAVTALAQRLGQRGGRLSVEATYAVASNDPLMMSFVAREVFARDVDGASPLRLELADDDSEGVVGASIDGRFNEVASVIEVATLRLELSLGRYARVLLQGLGAEQGVNSLGQELYAAGGCELVKAWAVTHPATSPYCEASCAAAACEAVLDSLQGAVAESFAVLDVDHEAIGLRGELPGYDRDEDGLVDELDEALLTGSWGKAAASNEPDIVTGVVSGQDPQAPLIP